MRCESRPASFLGKRQKFFYKRQKFSYTLKVTPEEQSVSQA